MRPNNTPLITALPASSNQNSGVLWSQDIVRASFQLASTGSAAGSLQIQFSNDQATGAPANKFVPTNWTNLGTATTVPAGPGVTGIPYIECSYEYMRIVYTDTTGGTATGTISVRAKTMSL